MSVSAEVIADHAPARRDAPSRKVVVAAMLLIVGGAGFLLQPFGWRQAVLYLIGAGFGLVLYHAAFGFAGTWRAFIVERRGDGLRAHMAMLGLATALFFPVLAEGTLFGQQVAGALAPVGVSVAVGALLFGIGMQLGGACASGTLYTAGGGNLRMLLTLAAFVAGAVIGSAHLPWWLERPSLGSVSLIDALGVPWGLALQLAVLAAIAMLTILLERRRRGGVGRATAPAWRLVDGPWPLLWGAAGLALLNFATLAVAGHPWSITFAFSLWGAKLLNAGGFDVAAWIFWTWPMPRQALQSSIFADTTSVMDIGILAGALLAAGLAGRFAPNLRIRPRAAAAAILGGLLMGYGARLAFGCNIGALFSGIASGSLHGWLWFGAAFMGNIIGTRLRPAFGLGVGGMPIGAARS